MEFLKEKLQSKKLRALIFGIIVVVMEYFGMEKESSLKIIGLLSSYMIGQGFADAGKEAVKAQASLDE